MKYRYFIARGRSYDTAAALEARQKAAHKAVCAFAEKHGCAQVYGGSDGDVSSASFKGPLPEGWRKGRGGYAYPLKKSKKGKEIAQELADLPRFNNGNELDAAFNSQPVIGAHASGLGIYHAVWQRLGDVMVIRIPAGEDGSQNPRPPDDAEEIGEADFLRLKAAAMEQDAKAKGGAA